MVDAGVLTTDDRVELLDGEVVAKMPQNKPHCVSTSLVGNALGPVFGAGAHVQVQAPIALSDLSEPEPDVAVVKGSPRDYDPHPGAEALLLIVEIADTSLLKDRGRMAALYAGAGVSEYWIVNLQENILEVHRDPAGGVYRTETTLMTTETIAPLGAPDATVAVADLLP